MWCAQHGVEGAGDLRVAVVRGVLVEQSGGGEGVAEPAHRPLDGRAGSCADRGTVVASSCGRIVAGAKVWREILSASPLS
jgi:hypothetical protein